MAPEKEIVGFAIAVALPVHASHIKKVPGAHIYQHPDIMMDTAEPDEGNVAADNTSVCDVEEGESVYSLTSIDRPC